MRRIIVLAGCAVVAVTAVRALARAEPFSHEEHAAMFPACIACHEGVADASAPVWPTAAQCAACHDGAVEERVAWAPPTDPPATNLRFDHQAHVRAAGDTVTCTDCHADDGAPRMQVRLAKADQCVACHGLGAPHLAVAAAECGTCHVPLAEANRLDATRVAAFAEPPAHGADGFATTHGNLVDASCATCHTAEFCSSCHVDAAEQPTIVGLGSHPRGRALAIGLDAPLTHQDPSFVEGHGAGVDAAASQCRTCHTQESCLECHRGTPQVAVALVAGRGPIGAVVSRHEPVDHSRVFTDWQHGPAADAATSRCAACHVRSDCLDCHRPGPASGGYHPVDFLSRHPAAAYGRETACSDCHNATGFCAACHRQSGLVATDQLRGGFHDGQPAFLVGHGPSARQSLESCVSCHTETDCLACHSSVRGRGFNPHGANFDAERLRRRNPEMCIVCHGVGIPGG